MVTIFGVRKMSQSLISKLLNNADTAEKRLADLKSKLKDIKLIKIEEKIRELINDNKVLTGKVENAKAELIRLETLHGKKQFSVPGKLTDPPQTKTTTDVPQIIKKEKKETAKKSNEAPKISEVVDIRKLDLRIGKIVEINKHPDADSLYVEKIDCGEENARTVVSGLVKHVPIEEMRNRMVMVLCNLKPAKMRGITSEAMVMCASSTEKVEVLIPPNGAVPGDLVSCEGYPREPEAVLNPKKKVFETCAPDLKTDDSGIACYKNSHLVVPGKGPVVAPTLKGVNVK